MGEHGSRERQLREARRRRSGGPLPAPPAPAVPRVGTPVPAPVDPEPAYAVAVAAHDRTRRPFGDEQPPVPAAPAGSAAALLPVVIAAAPVVAARIPPGPAAVLGRIGAPVLPGDTGLPVPPPEQVAAGLAERLLGALELAVPELPVAAPSALVDLLRADIPDGTGFAVVDWAHEPESVTAGRRVDQFAPRTRDLVAGLVAALVDDVALAPLSAAPEGAGDPEAVEAGLAAARGRGVLAVAVVTALAVLRATAHPMVGDGAPAVVGVALDAAARLLPGRPPHPAHLGAATALRRARFLLPRHAGGSVPVDGHRFALVDGPFPVDAPEPANGLVAAVPGGLVVRTGVQSGRVPVRLLVLADPPGDPDPGVWHEIVELSYVSRRGWASVIGPTGGEAGLHEQTAPRPGPVRARVCARGRDGSGEHYEITVWEAPPAPELVVRATDALGHRLRGEPEPAVRAQPEAAFRWVSGSALGEAATVTVATGVTPEQLLEAFGADPARPEPLDRQHEEMTADYATDPWVSVLPVPGAVLAVEFNGWTGSEGPVLRAASAEDRTASTYWNVDAMTRLSFARRGELLASFEPPPPEPVTDEEVRSALDGLDLDDYHDRTEKGLAAVARFTGYAIRPEDVERITGAGIGYRVLPHLPEHHPEQRLPDGSRRWAGHGPLGADTDALAQLPDDELRDLAWWAAEAAAERAGRADDPDVRATLTGRGFTPGAERAARESRLVRGSHHQLWLALHSAANPDALAAAIRTVEHAHWVFGPDAADFLDRVRARVPA